MKTFLLPLAAVALLTGCSFSVPDSAPEERGAAFSANSERSVLLSGSIKFSGAIPSAFKSNSSGRTAFPTAPTPLVYKIKATSGSSVIEFNSSEASSGGSITVDGDTITFTISLTSGTWALTASAEDSSGTKVLATKSAVSVPLSGDSPSVSLGDPLVLNYASSSSTGKGIIGLTLSCDSGTNIQSIKVNPLTSGITSTTTNTTSNWLWSQANINPGSYKVEFLFYSGTDCSGAILYRINEVVNVYSNLTTDTFEDASYVSSGHIEITDSLLASAELVTIYVSSSGSASGSGSYFNPVKTLNQAVTIVNNSSAAATTEFEIFVRDNISLGGSTTLNSGKKASITSEGSSAVTVSGGSSHDSLTISGEAEVSNLNFSGLGGINVDGTGNLTLDGSISSNSKIYLSSKDNPLEIGTSFTTASPITVELNTDPSDTSHFAFGDLAIKATEAQVDYFTTPTDSGYSLVYKTAKNGAVLAISGDDAIIYVGGTGADDDTGNGTATAPFATLYRAVAVAKERYELIEGDYIIKVQDTITESQNIVVEDVPGLTIAGKVPEDSSDTKQVNGNGKSITFKCDTTLKNLEFKSFEASSTSAGPVTIYSGKEVEAEYVKVTNCTNTSGHGGGIYNAGTLTLTNCTISGCKATADSSSNGWGGGIYNSYGSSLSLLEESTVEDNEAAHGGGIFIDNGCTAQITDSIIQSNTAKSTVSTGMGGGIFVNEGGSLTLSGSGSKVIQNTADSSTISSSSTIDKNAYGGGIFCYGSMTMTDGTISENTLVAGGAEYGGGIALVAISTSSSSTFTMSGGTISKNSAKLGGGISTQGINLTLSGGTIGASTYENGNTATQYGGGLYVGPYRSGLSTKKPDCTISGCTIKYNTANESGGGVFAEECTMTFSSGSVSNNKVYSDAAIYISGGGVYIKKGSLTISGTAEISNNMVSAGSGTLGVSGGGLFIYENGNVTMEGGSIKANIVSSSIASTGGGVYITNGKMTLSGGTIITNTASDTSGSIVPGGAMGGGFYINNSGELTMEGGSINSNTASTTYGSCFGGGIYSSGKLTLTSGELKSNSSSTMGGGIFVSPSVGSTDCSLTWNSTTITGNTASSMAPNYYINVETKFTGTIGVVNYAGTTLATALYN